MELLWLTLRVYLLQQDNKTRVSLPYDDIFESASSLMRFSSASSTSSDAIQARNAGQTGEDGMIGDSTAEDEAAAALLSEDMRRFGELDSTKKAMACICQVQSKYLVYFTTNTLSTRLKLFCIADITPDLSTYRLDDELLQTILKSKVEKLAAKETFEASATLSRVLAKEGITDSEGEAAELHAGA